MSLFYKCFFCNLYTYCTFYGYKLHVHREKNRAYVYDMSYFSVHVYEIGYFWAPVYEIGYFRVPVYEIINLT